MMVAWLSRRWRVAAGIVAAVLFLMVLAGGGDALLSAVAAGAAVVLPQVAVLVWARRAVVRGRLFGVWAAKFSMIFLLMASAARGLSAVELLLPLWFVFGVVVGVVVNGVLAYRWGVAGVATPAAVPVAAAVTTAGAMGGAAPVANVVTTGAAGVAKSVAAGGAMPVAAGATVGAAAARAEE